MDKRLFGLVYFTIKQNTSLYFMSTENKITDEMVKKFLNSTVPLPAYQNIDYWEKAWDTFKASHVSVGEWEITEIRHHRMKAQRVTKREEIANILEANFGYNWFIHSVRRLSDGLILCVNDKCECSFDDGKGFQGIINHFTFCSSNGIIDVYFKEQMHQCFSLRSLNISKVPPPEEKPVLMTTEDYKSMYAGDDVWGVALLSTGSDIIRQQTLPFDKYGPKTNRKWFSSYFAAANYVLMTKPLLSLEDLLSRWGNAPREQAIECPLYLGFKEIAESKIK